MTSATPSDAFLEAWRAGDAGAAAEFERRYRAPLARFCSGYLARREDAADAASEVIVKLLASDARPENLRLWLLRAARNHCLNVLRRQGGRPMPSGADWTARATGPFTAAERADEAAAIARALERLGEDERELLRLRYGEDLSRAEIADLIGIGESVVKSRLFEAVSKLRSIAKDGDQRR